MITVKSVIIGSLLPICAFSEATFQSAYTSIENRDCTTLYSTMFGGSSRCESYKDIGVEVLEEDLRQSITLIRNKHRYPLKLWSSVSSSFSFLGSKIEWRFSKKAKNKPFALITRYNISVGDYLEQTSSYLAVVKITNDEMCVVGKIKSQKNQNILARKMADQAKSLDCVLKE